MDSAKTPGWRTSPLTRWPAQTQTVALFFAFLALTTSFLAFLYDHNFVDEADNFVGGMVLSHGLKVYRDFYSQHTPLVYHMISYLYRLGIQNGPALRLAWATIFGLLIYGIYRLQKNEFGAMPALVLLIGLAAGTEHYWAHVVLSDGIQALGIVTAFYVFAQFKNLKQMPKTHMFALGLAAWGSIMSAFLSVYPLFVLALAFIWQEMRTIKVYPDCRSSPARYALLAGLIALPFALTVTFHWQQGTLEDFYYQAYTFNRTHYANYGAGTDTIWVLFLKPRLVLELFQLAMFNLVHGNHEPSVYLAGGVTIMATAGLIIGYRHCPTVACLTIYFLLMCGTRVVHSHFHALPIYAMSLGAIGFGLARATRPKFHHLFYSMSILASACIVTQTSHQAIRNIAELPTHGSMVATHHFIAEHTNADDTTWEGVLDPYLYVNTKRLPASRMTDLVPWFWDAYKNTLLSDLRQRMPKFIILDPHASLIGKKVSDYAPELIEFAKENYITPPHHSSPPTSIWMRKDVSLSPSRPAVAGN